MLPGPRTVRRRHCVGGGAPVNFGRRRWRGAALAAKKCFFKDSKKISFYPLMTFFSHRKLQQNKGTIILINPIIFYFFSIYCTDVTRWCKGMFSALQP